MYGAAYRTQKYCRQEEVSLVHCEKRIEEAYGYYNPKIAAANIAAEKQAEKQAEREKENREAFVAQMRHLEKLAEMRAIRNEVRDLQYDLQ